jgi:hypothetical protein
MLRSIQKLKELGLCLLICSSFFEVQFCELIVELGRGIVQFTSQVLEVSQTGVFIGLFEECNYLFTR